MKYFFGLLTTFLLTATALPIHAQTLVYDAQSMRDVVDHYCRDFQPVSSCGVYQTDINYAKTRASQLVNILGTKPSREQSLLIEGMLERVARSFYTATDPRQKLVSAWYYLYFNQRYSQINTQEIGQLTALLYGYDESDPLFTVTNQVRYETRPYVQVAPSVATQSPSVATQSADISTNNGGVIRSVSSLKGGEIFQGNTLIPTGRSGDIDLRIHTWVGSKAASRNNGYRVVVTTRSTGNKVFAANYQSNGNWELRMRPGSSIGDLTIYLLCQSCTSGTKFNKGSNYYGWTIVDSRLYTVGYARNSYDYYYGR